MRELLVPAICRRGSRADRESTSLTGRIIVLGLAVIVVAAFAGSATAASDPRVCTAPGGGFPLPAAQCAHRAAYDYFRGYMRGRLQLHDPVFPAVVSCSTAGGIFRYSCKFDGGWLRGLAVVSLGSAPVWKRTITFKSFVCLVRRPGCP